MLRGGGRGGGFKYVGGGGGFKYVAKFGCFDRSL